MSRWWTEFVATVTDVVPASLLVLLLFVAAAVVAALWYWFPAWVPRRWPRLRAPRWRRPRWRLRWPGWRWPRWRWPRWRLRWPDWLRWRAWRRPRSAPEPAEAAAVTEPVRGEELPDAPAESFTALADRLAAEGRYAEAVRERLRAMVRNLVDLGVIEHRPGWTVTELAGAAASARPVLGAPLGEAGRIFSDLWYGQRPARAEHDARMRALGVELHAAAGPGGRP